jgi:hypothetical protein
MCTVSRETVAPPAGSVGQSETSHAATRGGDTRQ